MTAPPVLAIDGPAGAGKTAVGRAVADKLGWRFFDTGVLYRAITWKALRDSVPLKDGEALARLVRTTTIEVTPSDGTDGREYDVLVDGENVTSAIREPEVDRSVSELSAHESVRSALVPAQRALAKPPGVVVAGRDIGTVIFPDAIAKVYLDASPGERARRRARQRGEQDPGRELRDIEKRDAYDSSRTAAPLRPADDALTISTDSLDVQQVVEQILAIVQGALGDRSSRAPVADSNEPG